MSTGLRITESVAHYRSSLQPAISLVKHASASMKSRSMPACTAMAMSWLKIER